ncbi:hypothetical protein JW960_19430 [candidate division KSB1 bacterium]|nr:hypothetical protein [candidate division KSB1 bacterium]
MKKIRDLIEIPHIETVIKINELYDYDSVNLQQKIYDTFVLTEEVLSGLALIVKKIARKENAGFIVKGSYGSGKSHLLAYIAAIAGSPALFKRLCVASQEIAHYQKEFFPGEMLAVPVSLTSYQQNISLENAVFDSIRKKIINTGISFPESISGKIMDDFKTFVAPDLTDEFFSQYGDAPIEGQVAHLREFLSDKNISFTPVMSRDDLYTIIEKSLQQHFPGGLVLLIDEVSEFLRSRSEIDINSEDIRFLQFLGEWNLSLNCWIVLSMQEDIEEISSMSEVALNKIRDRYNNRIHLSTTHIKELLKKRLSIKKDNSRDEINKIYFEFRDYFPTWTLDFEEFYNIYPVHPATVYYLESISNLFSKSRGMVEFFYNSLHADMPDSNLSYVDHDANVLITPDQVFDNFQDKIQENLATHDFVDKIYRDYTKEIPLIFKPSTDRDADEVREEIQVATRLVKILILTEIAPGLKKLTISKLAELTGKGVSQLEQDTNINYIRYVLSKLMAALSYIKREDVDGKYNDIYYISPEKTALNRFDDEVRKNIDRIASIEKKAIQLLIQNCAHPRLPLQNFYQREITEQCGWQETSRKLLVTMTMPDRIDDNLLTEWERKIEKGNVEYILALGYPVTGTEDKADLWRRISQRSFRMKKSFVYWQPNVIHGKPLQLLINYFAQQHTYRSILSENPAFFGGYETEIRQRIDDLSHQAMDIVIEAYFPPTLYMDGDVDVFMDVARIIVDFNQLKQKLTDRLLGELYTEHHKIKPIISEPPLSSIHEVLHYINDNIIGQHFIVPSESMKSLIKNLIEKLYLIKVRENDISIEPRPEQSTFVRELLKVIEGQRPGYDYLFPYLRHSVFGCTEPQFVMTLYMLSVAGYIQICVNGKPVKPNQLTVQMIQSADLIIPGEQVSQRFLKEHQKLAPLVGKINANELHLKGQERVWDELLQFRERNEHRIANKSALLERYRAIPPFTDATFSDDLKALDYLAKLLEHIKHSYPSRKGIDLVLVAVDSEAVLQEALLRLEHLLGLDNAKLQHIVFIHEYMSNPFVRDILQDSELLDQFQSINETITGFGSGLNGVNIERLFSDFEGFRSAYMQVYTVHHDSLYPKKYYAAVQNIRETSEYNVLQLLSGIELISVKNDLIHIDNLINSLLGMQCRNDLTRELQYKPVCACEYRNQSAERQYSGDELLDMIKSGILEYFAAIQSREIADKIIRYKLTFNQVHDQDRGNVLDFFLNMDTTSFPAGIELARNINANTIGIINEALTGDIRIIEKNLNELTDSLYGRKFKPAQIKQIFLDWLAESEMPDGDVYISISDIQRSSAKSQLANLPAILIDELRKLMPETTIERASELVILDYLNAMLKSYGIDVPGFKAELDEPAKRGMIIDLFPQSMDLLAWVSEKNRALLFEYLKPDTIPIDVLIKLYNEAQRFTAIRMAIIAALYKNINTFAEAPVIYKLTDQSAPTFFLRHFLLLNQLNRTPLQIPEAFFSFLQLAVDEMKNVYLCKKLISINQQQQYLPVEFSRFIEKPVQDRLIRLENEFQGNLAQWDTERNSIGRQLLKIRERESPRIIIIDGLRADFYLLLADELCKHVDAYVEEQHYCLSLRPSNTETYYELLDKHAIPYYKTVEREYNLEKFKSQFLSLDGGEQLYIISFLDEKIHSEKAGLVDLFGDFLSRLERFLFPILSQLPKETVFYISSDHGFAERTGYALKDESRYFHGGDSMAERIVPVGKFRKG